AAADTHVGLPAQHWHHPPAEPSVGAGDHHRRRHSAPAATGRTARPAASAPWHVRVRGPRRRLRLAPAAGDPHLAGRADLHHLHLSALTRHTSPKRQRGDALSPRWRLGLVACGSGCSFCHLSGYNPARVLLEEGASWPRTAAIWLSKPISSPRSIRTARLP